MMVCQTFFGDFFVENHRSKGQTLFIDKSRIVISAANQICFARRDIAHIKLWSKKASEQVFLETVRSMPGGPPPPAAGARLRPRDPPATAAAAGHTADGHRRRRGTAAARAAVAGSGVTPKGFGPPFPPSHVRTSANGPSASWELRPPPPPPLPSPSHADHRYPRILSLAVSPMEKAMGNGPRATRQARSHIRDLPRCFSSEHPSIRPWLFSFLPPILRVPPSPPPPIPRVGGEGFGSGAGPPGARDRRAGRCSWGSPTGTRASSPRPRSARGPSASAPPSPSTSPPGMPSTCPRRGSGGRGGRRVRAWPPAWRCSVGGGPCLRPGCRRAASPMTDDRMIGEGWPPRECRWQWVLWWWWWWWWWWCAFQRECVMSGCGTEAVGYQ